MKLTVGVPVYNAAKYINRCLESLLSQKNLDKIDCKLEVIAVDDGSIDGSGDILDRLATCHSNLKVIHTKNQGAFLARWEAIDAAEGEWIGFVDADDDVSETMYFKLLCAALSDEEIGMSVCAIEKEDNMGKYSFQMQTFGKSILDLKKNPEYFNAINPSFCNKIFDIRIARKAIRLKDRVDIMEDLLFVGSLYPFLRKVSFTDEPLYFYRYNKQSLTKTIGLMECKKAEPALKELIELYRTRYPQNIRIIQGLTVIHFGIAFTINLNYDQTSLKTVYRETKSFLNEELPGWEQNRLYSIWNLHKAGLAKVVVSGRLYQSIFWIPAVRVYKGCSKLLKIDMKW